MGAKLIEPLLDVHGDYPPGMIINPYAFAGGGGGSPTKLYDTITAASEGQWDFGDVNSQYYAAQENVTLGATYTITKIVVKLSKIAGDISGKTYVVKVWQSGAGANLPGSPTGTSDNVTGSNSWAKTNVDFAFTNTFSWVSGTNYHVTVQQTGAADNTNKAAGWHATPSIEANGQLDYFSDAGVNQFPNTFGNHDFQIQIWGTS